MNIKNIVFVAVVAIAVFAAGYMLGGSGLNLGANAGTTHYFAEEFFKTVTFSGSTVFSGAISNTAATTTLGCLRVYQKGATTVASTTYYLVASTTVNGDNYYPLFATSTKPAYCN